MNSDATLAIGFILFVLALLLCTALEESAKKEEKAKAMKNGGWVKR